MVYPNHPTQNEAKAKDRLLDGLKAGTGKQPGAKTDYLKRGQVYDSKTYEILLGATGYPEPADCQKELKKGQFCIAFKGNKIVITSAERNDIGTAVDWFLDQFLTENMKSEGESVYLMKKDYISPFKEEEIKLTVNGADIKGFSIIYDSRKTGYLEIARRMRNCLSETLGISMKLYSDTAHEPDGMPELLIGETNGRHRLQRISDHRTGNRPQSCGRYSDSQEAS